MNDTRQETASADLMVGGGIVREVLPRAARPAGLEPTSRAPKKVTRDSSLRAQISQQAGRGGPSDDTATDDDGRGFRMTTGRRFVNLAFTLIGVGVLGITLFAIGQTQSLQARARQIVDNMLASIRTVGTLKSEVQHRRILIDDHIFTRDVAEMASNKTVGSGLRRFHFEEIL